MIVNKQRATDGITSIFVKLRSCEPIQEIKEEHLHPKCGDLIHDRCDMVLKSFLEGFNPFASIQPFAAWNMAISIEENLFQQPQDAQYHKTSYVPVKQTDIWLLSCGIPNEFSDEVCCER